LHLGSVFPFCLTFYFPPPSKEAEPRDTLHLATPILCPSDGRFPDAEDCTELHAIWSFPVPHFLILESSVPRFHPRAALVVCRLGELSPGPRSSFFVCTSRPLVRLLVRHGSTVARCPPEPVHPGSSDAFPLSLLNIPHPAPNSLISTSFGPPRV